MKKDKTGNKVFLTGMLAKVALVAVLILVVPGAAFAKPKYKVNSPTVLVGVKAGDPAAVKTAIFEIYMEERMCPPPLSIIGGVFLAKTQTTRKDFVILQEEKGKAFGDAFIAEYSKRYGSDPIVLSTDTPKLNPDKLEPKVSLVSGTPGMYGAVDKAYVDKAAAVAQKAGVEQFIVLSGVLYVDKLNAFGTACEPVFNLYAVLYDLTGKPLKVTRLQVTDKGYKAEDTEKFGAMIPPAHASIPAMYDNMFGKKKK